LYYPLAPINLVVGPDGPGGRWKPATHWFDGFACVRCHRVRCFTRTDSSFWNDVVTFFTAGLLYGHEVPRPPGLKQGRKNRHAPKPNARPSRRRPQVLQLLLQGLTYEQIGQRLGVKYGAVNSYVVQIYAQHGVRGRHELARKLGRSLPPPSTKEEQVASLHSAGLTNRQIAQRLGLRPDLVYRHLWRRRQRQRPALRALKHEAASKSRRGDQGPKPAVLATD
jgi:DNA-binding CsgD family transcriptional regulator